MRHAIFCFVLSLAGAALAGCTQSQPTDGPGPVPPALPYVEPEPSEQREALAPNAPIWQSTADASGLKHLASGFICPIEQDGFLMIRDETFPGLGRGNDVACVFRTPEGGEVRLHLTYFGRGVSPSAHLKGIQRRIAEAEDSLDEVDLPQLPGFQATDTSAAYQIGAKSTLRPDVPVHTAIWIKEVNSWHIKARARYEADRGAQVGQLVSTLLNAANNTVRAPSSDAALENPP